ncbi:hypothetical protein Glove_137g130 [Diversispora epigaea]|uniref:BTB domain-containing protein n=1 Tax=Diversispora epigaea TaxID=1348612 RepID=A0A397J057_9GLOM|nr:hypothetical protein Glove_137g130 [Diversispora epigaea]
MDTLPKIRALFNDPSTADLTLRIDGRAYFAHKCILNLQSEWFQKYLEENRQVGKHFYLDFSCSKKMVIKKWYEYKIRNNNNEKDNINEKNDESNENNRKDFDESAFQYEIYYDYDIFGYLLAYCYGWSIQSKTTDELFAIAYLAKKFKIHSLTKFTDCLLKHISKSWKPNEFKWKVGLMISKWLGLVETRLTILKFLARILIKIKDSRNFELVKSIINKDDWNEIEKIMNELSNDETTDELFAIAYLAKKFKIHSLTKFTDCLLKHISKSWKPNEFKWKVGLMISKWLGLVETRLTILKFLARILIKIKDSRNFELVKSIINKDDWNEIEKIMNELSNDEVQIENELLEDGVLGLDENGNVVGPKDDDEEDNRKESSSDGDDDGSNSSESSSSYASSNENSNNESEDHQ